MWGVGSGCNSNPSEAQSERTPLPGHRHLDLEFVREFTILNDDTEVVVPCDKVWAIEGHTFVDGIHTADILFQGQAELGECYFSGRFWVTFCDPQTQPLWVYGGTRIVLGDTRRELTVREFQNNTPDE
jgi:hypothetical protein